ncbi:hypothetical protein BJ508DRAFT_415600 [Ascobolus immersus RN42]|uniref:Uncharacterized protein n=1 Tax=Ascobolus immersus RN42 TaxID=1160509 RepID=A0A3N4I1S4_ASCIM|nr:hypothetical protein BJ508DRAFT_415600 [Ascobolus immersus RN42]
MNWKFPTLSKRTTKRFTLLPQSAPAVPEKSHSTTSTPRPTSKATNYTSNDVEYAYSTHSATSTPRPLSSRLSTFLPRIKRTSLLFTPPTPQHPYLHVPPSLASSGSVGRESLVSGGSSRPPTPPPKDYDEIRELKGFRDRRHRRRREEGKGKHVGVEVREREEGRDNGAAGVGGREGEQEKMEAYLMGCYGSPGPVEGR